MQCATVNLQQPWTSLNRPYVEGDEGLFLLNCQTNLNIDPQDMPPVANLIKPLRS